MLSYKTISTLIGMFQVLQHENVLSTSPIVVFDANINGPAMRTLLNLCRDHNIPGE